MKNLFRFISLLCIAAISIFFTGVDGNSAKRINDFHETHDYSIDIPDSLLDRDFMMVTRVVNCTTKGDPIALFPADIVNERVVRFIKEPDNKIAIISMLEREIIDRPGNLNIYKKTSPANESSVLARFPNHNLSNRVNSILLTNDGNIDSTKNIFFFRKGNDKGYGLMGYALNKSVVSNFHNFSGNIEVGVVNTYRHNKSQEEATLELNTSLFLLPPPMKPRYFNPSVGYYEQKIIDTGKDAKDVRTAITRWRLEPKPGEWAKYLKGQLVEPIQPIVFYIDPSAPAKWIPYFIKGVNAWQKAFESAGFKNAIIGKMPPTWQEDSTWSLFSSRHGAVIFQANNKERNSSYTTIVDPRTGEILESHVVMFGGIIKDVSLQYIVQASPSDKRARKANLDDDLVGELVQTVVSHEVGHALGFHHNMGASSSIPVENLRNKKWVEKNGICNSIMDYTRYNYVAQPQDNISPGKGLNKTIGLYDEWAVKWGYQLLSPTVSEDAEKDTLVKWIAAKSKDQRFYYGGEGLLFDDPRSQGEDIGNNDMKADEYGIKNLKFILSNLPAWIHDTNNPDVNIKEAWDEIFHQFNNYMNHAVTYIGGEYDSHTPTGEKVVATVPAVLQEEAFSFLEKHLFTIPRWILDTTIVVPTLTEKKALLKQRSAAHLSKLMSLRKINNLVRFSLCEKPYTVQTYFLQLKKLVWNGPDSSGYASDYKKNLQVNYINNLIGIIKTKPNMPLLPVTVGELAVIVEIAKSELALLKKDIEVKKQNMKNDSELNFLNQLLSKIEP